jgi:hypothetical protein
LISDDIDASISHNLKSSKNINLSEAIAQTVITKDELGKKTQPSRMVTRSRNSPGLVASSGKQVPSATVSPMSIRKREQKHRTKEKENINLNQRGVTKLDGLDDKKMGFEPVQDPRDKMATRRVHHHSLKGFR